MKIGVPDFNESRFSGFLAASRRQLSQAKGKKFRAGLLALTSLATLVFASSALGATATVGLGTAASFSVLGGSTVTNTGPTTMFGDLGLAPGSSVTGAPHVLGQTHVDDAVAIGAKNDLTTAYNNAAGRPSSGSAGTDLAGQTFLPGVRTASSSLLLSSGSVTLDAQGDPNAVFIFQMGSTLITGSGTSVALINGAQACNVFWQIGSSATLGTGTRFVGTVMALATITANTAATIHGRLLAADRRGEPRHQHDHHLQLRFQRERIWWRHRNDDAGRRRRVDRSNTGRRSDRRRNRGRRRETADRRHETADRLENDRQRKPQTPPRTQTRALSCPGCAPAQTGLVHRMTEARRSPGDREVARHAGHDNDDPSRPAALVRVALCPAPGSRLAASRRGDVPARPHVRLGRRPGPSGPPAGDHAARGPSHRSPGLSDALGRVAGGSTRACSPPDHRRADHVARDRTLDCCGWDGVAAGHASRPPQRIDRLDHIARHHAHSRRHGTSSSTSLAVG